MKINKVNLRSFGLFQNKEIHFKPGMNIIYGNNEAGKSTTHKFIESMLFGMNEEYTHSRINNEDYLKYKPWDQSTYCGDMVYEHEGREFKIDRDFLKEEDGVTIQNAMTGQDISEEFDYDVVKKERKPLSRLNRMNFLSNLAISDMSNKSAKSLVQEIKNRIVNIKTSNSSIISVETALSEMEKKILTLKEDANIRKCYESMNQLEAELESDLLIQNELKTLGKQLFDLKRELIKEQNEEKTILNRIHYKKYLALEEKYNNLCNLNKEIELLNEEIEHLDLLAYIEGNDVNTYIEKNDYISDLRTQIQQKREEYEQVKVQMKELNLDLPASAITALADDVYVGDFINDMTIYCHQFDDMKEMDERIASYKETLQKAQAEEGISEDLPSEEEKLEKNYYKAVHLDSIMKQVDTGDIDRNIVTNQSQLSIHKKKAATQAQFSGLFFILFGMAIVGFLLLPEQKVLFGALIGCFFAGAIAFGVLLIAVLQQVNNYRYLIEHMVEEKSGMLQKIAENKARLDEILRNYSCQGIEELEAYYNRKRKQKKSDVNIGDELELLEQKREIMVYQQNIQERRVAKWIKDTSLNQHIEAGDRVEGIAKLRELSRLCMRYMKLESMLYKLESEISTTQKTIDEIEESIRLDSAFENLRTYTVEDIRKKKELYIQLQDKRQSVIDERKKLMLGQKEEELAEKVSKENEIVNGFEFENAESITIDELNLLHVEVKDRIIDLFQRINDLRNKIYQKENRTRKNSDIQRELQYYTKLILNHSKKIEQYEAAYETIQRVEKQIAEAYSVELDRAIGNIIEKITNKYDKIVFDEDMRVFVREKETKLLLAAEKLSLGAIDQIYFGIRAGLVHSLTNQIEIPLVLDDCFSNYDNHRLERVLSEISRLDRQILIFTCQDREMNTLNRLQVPYNYIEI